MIVLESVKRWNDSKIVVIYRVHAGCMCSQPARKSFVIDSEEDLDMDKVYELVSQRESNRHEKI